MCFSQWILWEHQKKTIGGENEIAPWETLEIVGRVMNATVIIQENS